MIEKLKELIPQVYQDLGQPESWDSLIINRRKPYTYRIFKYYGDYRVCLHQFEPCESEESFAHPHPWPGAFLILDGSYIHTVGTSFYLEDKRPDMFYREILRAGSMYEILYPHIWHSVQPLSLTRSIMVNGPPWENPHSSVRTTKGKDLEKIPEEEMLELFNMFKMLLYYYL